MKQSGVLIFWWRTHPATSYVAAMFHPTIGQLAHQSLSNAATPKLGMIPPRIRVNAGLHITKGIQSVNQTQLGLTCLQQSTKPAQSKDQPLLTCSKTIPSHPCEEGKDNRWQSQTKGETQLKPTRQLRVVLGPKVAKTTQLQHPNQGISAAQTHNKW